MYSLPGCKHKKATLFGCPSLVEANDELPILCTSSTALSPVVTDAPTARERRTRRRMEDMRNIAIVCSRPEVEKGAWKGVLLCCGLPARVGNQSHTGPFSCSTCRS